MVACFQDTIPQAQRTGITSTEGSLLAKALKALTPRGSLLALGHGGLGETLSHSDRQPQLGPEVFRALVPWQLHDVEAGACL